jgi:uncharacterized membrane protein
MGPQPAQADRRFSMGEMVAYTTLWAIVLAFRRFVSTSGLSGLALELWAFAGGFAVYALLGMTIAFVVSGRRSASLGFIAGGVVGACIGTTLLELWTLFPFACFACYAWLARPARLKQKGIYGEDSFF